MGLSVSPDRPLARLLVRGMAGASAAPDRTRCYAPPVQVPCPDDHTEVGASAGAQCAQIWRCLVLGNALGELSDLLAPDVTTWSPELLLTGRDQLSAALQASTYGDGSLTEVALDVTSIDVVSPRVYVTWRLTGRFTSECFVADDVLVDPTGALVETAGVFVALFGGERITALHCYYDELALLEQLITLR